LLSAVQPWLRARLPIGRKLQTAIRLPKDKVLCITARTTSSSIIAIVATIGITMSGATMIDASSAA